MPSGGVQHRKQPATHGKFVSVLHFNRSGPFTDFNFFYVIPLFLSSASDGEFLYLLTCYLSDLSLHGFPTSFLPCTHHPVNWVSAFVI